MMNALFIGGTGIISTACVELALKNGWKVSLLNRGNRNQIPNTESIVGDVNDLEACSKLLAGRAWDAVIDFTAFKPDEVESRIRLFENATQQYVFISSASAYQKPTQHYLIDESTPLHNPFWGYSRDKAACEAILLQAVQDSGFPATIVRPSLTYGDTQIPLAMNSWLKPYTAVDRLRKGKPVIVPGDGTSLWTVTHNSDFAKGLIGLLGNPATLGHAFHITSDEALTWDQIYRITARAAGVDNPKLVHISSDFLAACIPDLEGTLIGDKAVSALFDNSKIKRFVPGYVATTGFAEGIRKTLAYFDAHPEMQEIDDQENRDYDLMIEMYESGLKAACAAFKNR